MTDKQPDALEVAAFCDGNVLYHPAATMLRTQHAAIERKDALLRQALEVLEFDMGKFAFGDYYAAREEAVGAITKELAK